MHMPCSEHAIGDIHIVLGIAGHARSFGTFTFEHGASGPLQWADKKTGRPLQWADKKTGRPLQWADKKTGRPLQWADKKTGRTLPNQATPRRPSAAATKRSRAKRDGSTSYTCRRPTQPVPRDIARRIGKRARLAEPKRDVARQPVMTPRPLDPPLPSHLFSPLAKPDTRAAARGFGGHASFLPDRVEVPVGCGYMLNVLDVPPSEEVPEKLKGGTWRDAEARQGAPRSMGTRSPGSVTYELYPSDDAMVPGTGPLGQWYSDIERDEKPYYAPPYPCSDATVAPARQLDEKAQTELLRGFLASPLPE